MDRKPIVLLLLACCLIAAAGIPYRAAAADAPVLALAADSSSLAVGQDVQVTVHGDRLDDLYGYEIQLQYDSGKLRFKGASPHWTGFQVPVQEQDGTLIAAHTKIGNTAGETGSRRLMTFLFEAIESGEATIELQSIKLVDSRVVTVTLAPESALTLYVQNSHPTIEFADMEAHWAKEAVMRAASLGFVNGFPDGTFRPDLNITRAQFAVMLARAIRLDQGEEGVVTYKDVQEHPEWARPHIAAATLAGVIQGYPDGTFRAGSVITRAEMAVMLARAAKLSAVEAPPASVFADGEHIPPWAAAAVEAACRVGILTGKDNGRFDPAGGATRAQAAVAIVRIIDNPGY